MEFVSVADLVDPEDAEGRTYRQINNVKEHGISVGTLVELETGARLFVVHHSRDCDGTPLYCLSPDKNDTVVRLPGFANPGWVHGYPEYSLKVVQ